MDKIVLQGKKELDIYINPQRQKLLRCMRIAGQPLTPKQLSDQLDISASAVQHHIKKLVELGIVALSHTQNIHGITARYYQVLPKTITIGTTVQDATYDQRVAVMQNEVSQVFNGFSEELAKRPQDVPDSLFQGDMMTGIVRLTQAEAQQVHAMIRTFLDAHEQEGRAGDAWEYALIAYPVAKDE